MASSLATNISLSTILVLVVASPLLLPIMAASTPMNLETKNIPSLAARLKLEYKDGEASSPDCWGSLYQLQACTGEVITFFLNGETYLGPSCCHAIRVIQHECWPDLLETLGLTGQEGDILEGYCDGEAIENTNISSPPTPTSIP